MLRTKRLPLLGNTRNIDWIKIDWSKIGENVVILSVMAAAVILIGTMAMILADVFGVDVSRWM